MCLPPANARIWPNPLLYSAVYHRYSLKSFQLCKSLLERDCDTCAVYLRENIQPLLSRPTHFAHAGLARNVLKNV